MEHEDQNKKSGLENQMQDIAQAKTFIQIKEIVALEFTKHKTSVHNSMHQLCKTNQFTKY